MVEETVVKEEEAVLVKRPLEVAKERLALEVTLVVVLKKARPVSVKVPVRVPAAVEVEYLFPPASKSAKMVPLGVRNSEVEATPNQLIENLVALAVCKCRKSTPVVEALVTMER